MTRNFKPYVTGRAGTGRKVRSRRYQKLMLLLIVVIIGMVVLIKSQTVDEPSSENVALPPEVALDDILPPSRNSAQRPADSLAETAVNEGGEQVETAQEAPAPFDEGEPVAELEPETDVKPDVVAEQSPQQADDDKTSQEAQALIEEALNLRDDGKIVVARDMLNQALNMQLSPQIRTGIKSQLASLSEKWLFSSEVLQEDELTGYYLVQPGDLLSRIGRNHKVPYELLMHINGIERPELLRAGQRIKIVHGPFHAVVNRTTFTLDVYLQDVYVKSYEVGLGRPEHTTPTGRWLVAPGGKMISPTWTDPDTGITYRASHPNYPLGSRWIGLEGIEGQAKGRTGFALHGTHEPETIGTLSSRGCVRLHNGDVIELYEMLESGHSNVQVVD